MLNTRYPTSRMRNSLVAIVVNFSLLICLAAPFRFGRITVERRLRPLCSIVRAAMMSFITNRFPVRLSRGLIQLARAQIEY